MYIICAYDFGHFLIRKQSIHGLKIDYILHIDRAIKLCHTRIKGTMWLEQGPYLSARVLRGLTKWGITNQWPYNFSSRNTLPP